MCGRISLFAELGDLASQFRFALNRVVDGYQSSWNIAPTARILVVTAGAGERAAGLIRWGFTFGGQARGGSSSRPLFNARAETVAERPAFRAAFARRRCLIPANGFYEWQSGGGGKTPMWIHRTDERPFALAGIYDAGPNRAASVITSAPNSLMAPIHHRMPALLDAGDYDAWLDPDDRRRNPPRAAATGGVAGNDDTASLQRGELGCQRWLAAHCAGDRCQSAAAVSGRGHTQPERSLRSQCGAFTWQRDLRRPEHAQGPAAGRCHLTGGTGATGWSSSPDWSRRRCRSAFSTPNTGASWTGCVTATRASAGGAPGRRCPR